MLRRITIRSIANSVAGYPDKKRDAVAGLGLHLLKNDPDNTVREQAIELLGAARVATPEVVKALGEELLGYKNMPLAAESLLKLPKGSASLLTDKLLKQIEVSNELEMPELLRVLAHHEPDWEKSGASKLLIKLMEDPEFNGKEKYAAAQRMVVEMLEQHHTLPDTGLGLFLPLVKEQKLKTAIERKDFAKIKKLVKDGVETKLPKLPDRLLDCLDDATACRLVEMTVDVIKGELIVDAARGGHIKAMKLLLEKGADPNASGAHALVSAAWRGQIEAVKLLLEKGADPNADDGYALASAAEQGQINAMKLLLEKGADPNAGRGRALAWSARHGQIEAVKLLLENNTSTQVIREVLDTVLPTVKNPGGEVRQMLSDALKKK